MDFPLPHFPELSTLRIRFGVYHVYILAEVKKCKHHCYWYICKSVWCRHISARSKRTHHGSRICAWVSREPFHPSRNKCVMQVIYAVCLYGKTLLRNIIDTPIFMSSSITHKLCQCCCYYFYRSVHVQKY